jgi:hypothetical protein
MPQPTPAQPSNALARWQRITIVAVAANLLASGLAWLPFHYAWGAGSANALPHPIEPWLMRWHGLAAVAGFYAAGLVSAGHVARGWRLRWHRRSGLAVCILGGALAVSGTPSGTSWRRSCTPPSVSRTPLRVSSPSR